MPPQARPGFYLIKGSVTIESPENTKVIEELMRKLEMHCPVRDMLRDVPIRLVLNHLQTTE